MNITRKWAFWRRVQYGSGFTVFLLMVASLVYITNFHHAPTCSDGKQNGQERGVDCGGGCARICPFDVQAPTVKWARSFRVTDGQYNAVAYIENRNRDAASSEVPYTFSLYDADGLITKRSGSTILPPDSVYPVFEARINTEGREPTQTFVELGDINTWVQSTKGPDQFTVQSRELTGADTHPRLDVRLYNNALTPAKEVEVVATIFDAHGNALTSSRTYIDDFGPRQSKMAVFTWPEPIAKTLRSCDVPTDVLLAIDTSGSMNNDGGNPPQPISSVLSAAEAFTQRLQDGDQVGLLTFATQATLIDKLSSEKQKVTKDIKALTIKPKDEHGTTNTGDALLQAGAALTSARHNPEARKVLVLLTDGKATAPEEDPEQYAKDAAEKIKAQGINIFTIGLGEQADMDFLRTIASTPQQAYRALSLTDIDTMYRSITNAICEDGAAIIEVIPKTTAGFSTIQ